MSEYQFVAFRAIDTPVTQENLEYMQQQSSRAEITPWSFDNEYNYSDFSGDAQEMLFRGYDMHLHYANFGIRRLMIRLSHGLPDRRVVKPYLDGEALQFIKDKKGPGGILMIEPCHEAGDLDDLWDLGELLDRLLPLRDEILSGDLRPLYLASLAVLSDCNHDPDEEQEPPVPAGLEQLTDAQYALLEFYNLGKNLAGAAAKGGSPLPKANDPTANYNVWLSTQTTAQKEKWLFQIMSGSAVQIRRDLLKAFQKSGTHPAWPTTAGTRTIAELLDAADKILEVEEQQAEAVEANHRLKRLLEMGNDPQPTLKLIEELIAKRGRDSYRQAAELLGELRAALRNAKQPDVTEQRALKLVQKHPTLNVLKAELKRQGFLGAKA